jgi:hypothetical protein
MKGELCNKYRIQEEEAFNKSQVVRALLRLEGATCACRRSTHLSASGERLAGCYESTSGLYRTTAVSRVRTCAICNFEYCSPILLSFTAGTYIYTHIYIYIYRVSQKDVNKRLIFRIIMCIHLFGIPCIYIVNFFFPVDLQSLKDLGRLTYRRFLELFGHMVGLFGRVISPSQGLYLHRTTQHRKTRTNIHALSGIRTHDPNNQLAKTQASDRTA